MDDKDDKKEVEFPPFVVATSIPPRPAPVAVVADVVQSADGVQQLIRVRFDTVYGPLVFYFEAAQFEQLLDQFRTAGNMARLAKSANVRTPRLK